MNFLYKLVMLLVYAVVVASAGDRASPLDEIDLETGNIIKGEAVVTATNDRSVGAAQAGDSKDNLHELSTGRRSGDADEYINNETLDSYGCCCKNVPTNAKWMWGGAAASWGVTIGLICYEYGYGACDASGGAMVCAYVFCGLGVGFGARGYYIFNGQDRENLLN